MYKICIRLVHSSCCCTVWLQYSAQTKFKNDLGIRALGFPHSSYYNPVAGERERWRRNRTGRPLSPSQIPQKNISTQSKLHKTTSVGWQRTSGNQKSRPLSSNTVNLSECPSMWRNFSSLTQMFYHRCCIDGEVQRLL